MSVSPFHRGEQDVQSRVGVRESSENIGQRFIRDHLPAEHKAFYSQLPFVLVGASDTDGRPWATILMGRPGFVNVPDTRTVEFNTRLVFGDPLQRSLVKGSDLGLLGIEYHSRRRNRLTGKVISTSEESIAIAVSQTFGNCPQYIQSRDYELLPNIDAIGEQRPTQKFNRLSDRAKEIIDAADHFFIATHYSEGGDDSNQGADVSHRGGSPGFVRVENDTTLIFPDFSGNNHFNTIGNLFLNPKAGLLFIDFGTGDLLYMTCTTEIIWDSEETQAFVGAERLVRLRLDEAVLIEDAVPIRWSFRDYSPSLGFTGSWAEVDEKLAALREGNKLRDFRIIRVEHESETISSFYLKPANCEKIPCHVAGQFLPIEIEPTGSGTPIRRTYTISNAPNGDHYRLSIKREPGADQDAPPGISSSFFHDHVSRGTTVRALSPRGKFTLDDSSARPVVLISGGVGVTPMISMLEQLRMDSEGCGCTRPVWFIHCAVNSDVHAFRDHVQKIAQDYPCLTTHVRYSNPLPADLERKNHDSTGHVDTELLRSMLPLDDYDFYLCGPTAFMESVFDALTNLGAAEERIHYEFFGAGATLGKQRAAVSSIGDLEGLRPVPVHFARSGIQTTWDPSKGSLLELAESEGLQPAYSCRSGVCQTCATIVTQGDVAYAELPMVDPGERTALICSAYPKSASDTGDDDQPLILEL